MSNWGIVGTGFIASKFADAVPFVSSAKLMAVASRSNEKASEFGLKYGVSKCYGSYKALYDDPEIDVVYIATPHTDHYEQTMHALEKGKHVLCEKPMTTTIKQAEEMIQKAKEKNLFFMEAMWTCFLPSYQKVFELIEHGVIGEVRQVISDFSFCLPFDPKARHFNKELGGGSLLDVGPYPCSLIYDVFGESEEVHALANFTSTGVDSSFAAIYKFGDKGTASFTTSVVAEGGIESIITGTKGRIKIEGKWFTPSNLQVYGVDDMEGEQVLVPTEGNGYNYEIEEVENCLSQNKIESDVISHSRSLYMMRHLLELADKVGLVY